MDIKCPFTQTGDAHHASYTMPAGRSVVPKFDINHSLMAVRPVPPILIVLLFLSYTPDMNCTRIPLLFACVATTTYFSSTGQSCNTAVPVCNGEFVLTQSSDTFALIRSTAYEEYIVENTITVPFDSVTSKNVFCGKMVKLDE